MAKVTIRGKEFPLCLTVAALDKINEKCGGLNELTDFLLGSNDLSKAFYNTAWLLDLLLEEGEKNRQVCNSFDGNTVEAATLPTYEQLCSMATIADINDAFKDVDQSRNNVSGTMAAIKTDFADIMEEIAADARQYGIFVGTNFVEGLSESLIPQTKGYIAQSGGSQQFGILPQYNLAPDLSEYNPNYRKGLDGQLERANNYPGFYSGSSTQTTTTSKTLNMGGITVQINAQPGQDVYEIAQAVQEVLQTEIDREEAGL